MAYGTSRLGARLNAFRLNYLGSGAVAGEVYASAFIELRPEPLVVLEMEFLGKRQGWTIVRDWYTSPGISFHRGLPGHEMTDLVADIGTMNFTLDNSAKNSAGLVGYYSPDHANKRYGFYLNIGVRLRYGNDVRFTGTLIAIDPVPGLYGPRTVICEAADWMSVADRTRIDNMPVLVNKKGEVVFTTIIESLPVGSRPDAIETDASPDTYPYTLDRARDEQTVVRDELYRLCLSGAARVYMRGDGTLVYESRSRRAMVTQTVVDTFTDSHGFAATHDRNAIVNRAQATIHPRIPATVDVVLYALPAAVPMDLDVPITILGPWTDPANQDRRVGAVSLVPVAAATDYAANTFSNGAGTDLTANLVVTTGLSGNSTSFTVRLTGSTKGFVTKLQQRGKPLYDYGSVVLQWEDAASIGQFGVTNATIDMPYSADTALALELAQFAVYTGAFPLTNVSGFTRTHDIRDTFERGRSISRNVSDRIGISDPVTGIVKPFFIQSVDESIRDYVLTTSWVLVPADTTAYWELEVEGKTELDLTTRLAFGQIIGHTDIPHSDSHNDVGHVDAVHSDAHTDSAHYDVAHGDGVAVHGDTAYSHSDTPHANSAHSDVALVNWHTDVPHTDVAHSDSHSNVGHGDNPHGDSHANSHANTAGTNFGDHMDCPRFQDQYANYHGDHWDGPHDDIWHYTIWAHLDCWTSPYPGSDPNPYGSSHTDQAHTDRTQDEDGHYNMGHHDDWAQHWDFAHGDSHSDSHSDSHWDQAHADYHSNVAHQDTAYQSAHGDVPHSDIAHGDYPHSDITINHSDSVTHLDTAHTDIAHGDVPHQDVLHGDSPHVDTHGDFHGDVG